MIQLFCRSQLERQRKIKRLWGYSLPQKIRDTCKHTRSQVIQGNNYKFKSLGACDFKMNSYKKKWFKLQSSSMDKMRDKVVLWV